MFEGELHDLANQLDEHLSSLPAAGREIPCWLIESESVRRPPSADLLQSCFCRYGIRRFENDEPNRFWLYEEDFRNSSDVFDWLDGLGDAVTKLPPKLKSHVHVGWCEHYLKTETIPAAHAIDALFPFPEPVSPERYLHTLLPADVSFSTFSGSNNSPGSYELSIPGFRRLAAEGLQLLINRLRSGMGPIDPSGKYRFCCCDGWEKERRRLKHADEIIPIIQDLKTRWLRADDPAPYGPQELIDDLWADMVPLGWMIKECPHLPEVGPFAFVINVSAHRSLWREFHSALATAERIALSNVTPQQLHSKGNLLSPGNVPHFAGGTMLFSVNGVELCGIDICSGTRSPIRRQFLELLSKKRPNGKFVPYSGNKLASNLNCDVSAVAGLARDLRNSITEAFINHNVSCDRDSVILSGGAGYRLAENITVQVEGVESIGDIGDKGNVPNVPNLDSADHLDVPSRLGRKPSLDEPVARTATENRKTWVLQQLRDGAQLKARDVVKHFSCSVKTAKRDLMALKDAGKITYVGDKRTGHYCLFQIEKNRVIKRLSDRLD